jgi:hypothetical protein
VAERGRVVTNTDVTCDDREERGLVGQSVRGGQMNRVQSADWFHGERASCLAEDRLSDAHDVTTPGEPLEGEECRSLLLSRNPSREAGAKNGPAGLGKRESGRHPLSLGANGDFRSRISLKHGRNQGA